MSGWYERSCAKIEAMRGRDDLLILAIESSCDETACAITRGREILSDVIASQIDIHKRYGGVVPEIASRNHVMAISGVVSQALADAGVSADELDCVAVTYGSGLLGALLVGVSFAKAFAYALDKPLIAVNHIKGHIAANYLAFPDLKPPYICLIASGGHTAVAKVTGLDEIELLGTTQDDAAGEAFDKVARILGLPYPGGPSVEKLARGGRAVIPLPKMFAGGGYDFSYSGLKTAVLNYCHNREQRGESYSRADVAASFQSAACGVLVSRAVAAAREKGCDTVAAGGGVIANGYLRELLAKRCGEAGLRLVLPEKKFCTDNAAMIAAEGLVQYRAGNFAPLTLNACAHIPLGRKGKQ